MKKLLLFLGVFVLTISASSLIASANDQLSGTDSEDLNDFLYGDLNPGETVVDFYREPISADELGALPTLEKLPSLTIDDEVTTYERRLNWYTTQKTYMGLVYGSWLYAGASTLTGGSLSASHSSTVANTFSGQLNAPKNRVDAFVGFNISYSRSKTVGYTSYPTPNGKYRLEYRHVYKKHKVKQDRKYDPRESVSYGTAYVYPKQWIERQYRVVKF